MTLGTTRRPRSYGRRDSLSRLGDRGRLSKPLDGAMRLLDVCVRRSPSSEKVDRLIFTTHGIHELLSFASLKS